MLKIDPKLDLSQARAGNTGASATPTHNRAFSNRWPLTGKPAAQHTRPLPLSSDHAATLGPRIVWCAAPSTPPSARRGQGPDLAAKRRRTPIHLVSSAARERLAARQLRHTATRSRFIESAYLLAAAATAAILWWSTR